MLCGGSPCQDLSGLSKNSNLQLSGPKSSLFYEYVSALALFKPKYFLFENIKCSNKTKDEISKNLGCEPKLINSKDFVPQSRSRYYWTNIGFDVIVPTNKTLTSILEKPENVPDKYFLTEGRFKWLHSDSGKKSISLSYTSIDPEIAQCLTARSETSWNCNYVTQNSLLRKLMPIEYERLQGIPDNYTNCVSDSQRYKMIGNGWTIDVIAHIFKGLK